MLPSSVSSWVFAGLAVFSFIAWIAVIVYTLKLILPWFEESSRTDSLEKKIIDVLEAQNKDVMAKLTEISDKLDRKTTKNE